MCVRTFLFIQRKRHVHIYYIKLYCGTELLEINYDTPFKPPTVPHLTIVNVINSE